MNGGVYMMAFCEHCHDLVNYKEVTSIEKSKNIKGKEIRYFGKEASCEECGESIFVSEIRDYNLIELDKAYRESEGLIFISDIELILNQYSIGKRPLSLLLGWGELTVTRYLKGDLPSKQYSDILKKILLDVNYFREVLEENKSKITPTAYQRSRNALNFLETGHIKNDIKIENVIAYFLEKSTDITPLALQKLLYYAQGFNKIFNKEYLFVEECEAWIHGPVYRDIYEKYKTYRYNPIEESTKNFNYSELTEAEIELLDSIIHNFGCYSGKVLEKMTHTESPWLETRGDLKEDENCDSIIEKQLIKNYFLEVKDKYKMINVSDIKDYSGDMFSKLNS